MEFKPTEYSLLNVADGHVLQDEGWTLSDPASQSPSMVRAVYKDKKFTADPTQEGLYRYHRWMPLKRTLKGSCAPVTYKSEGLAATLGLNNLYITFSGWNPEIGARFGTCSFKETEAYSVCGRLAPDEKRILVVASAGNTARAFASVCSKNNIPLLISIPYDNIDALWFDEPLNPCVRIIASPAGSDYFDSIALADKVCTSPAFLAEGGAKNIARRDGMGTTLLSAVEKIGAIPDFYFQAVGSGTGAIAAWENNLRLIEDGSFGAKKMRIMASQNDPFTIMYDSWALKQRALVDFPAEKARKAAAAIRAKVLSNRKPPYSLAGGLYDALADTDGTMYKVTNEELAIWQQEFERTEGYDIYSAASVAVASLHQAVAAGEVRADDIIMLNITGGGEKKAKATLADRIFYAKPHLVLDPDEDADKIISQVEKLY